MVTVLSKVKDILIGVSSGSKYTWVGIDQVKWDESDTWCKLPLTKSVYAFQDILPYLLEGTITCVDYSTLATALFSTNIDASNNKAVDSATMRKHKVTYFVIEAYGKVTTETKNYTFTNFRVKGVSLSGLTSIPSSNAPKFDVHFYADLVTY